MADGVNRVTLLGNLGADPELKFGGNGNALMKLRIATTTSRFDKTTNERKESTQWHQATLFGKRAESLQKHLNKGDRVYVEGRLEYSSYEKDGQKVYRTDIIVDEIVLCGGRGQGVSAGGGGDYQRSAPRAPKPSYGPNAQDNDFGPADTGDNDIPF